MKTSMIRAGQLARQPAKTAFQSCAHPLSDPIDKKKPRMLTRLNWSLLGSRSALGQLAALHLNNLPKNAPITALNPGCLARLLLA